METELSRLDGVIDLVVDRVDRSWDGYIKDEFLNSGEAK